MALSAVEQKAEKVKTAVLAIPEKIQMATELILKDGAEITPEAVVAVGASVLVVPKLEECLGLSRRCD